MGAGAADLRLVIPAVVVWAATIACLFGRGPVAVGLAVLGVLGAVAIAGVVYAGWWSWSLAGLIVVSLGLLAVTATALALRLQVIDNHPLSDAGRKATVSVSVTDDPRSLGPNARGRVSVAVRVLAVGADSVRPVAAEVVGAGDTWGRLVPGQRVTSLVGVREPRGHDLLVARLTAQGEPTIHGPPPVLQRAAQHIRERLRSNSFRALSNSASGLLPGLVLGDESMADPQVRDEFRLSGLAHLTAVSGANFAIICGAAVLLLRLCGAPPTVIVVCGGLVIIAFAILVRPSPSVLRAALMGAIGLLALWSSRRSQALPALGGAVIVGLLWWPQLAVSPGFALSVAATLGLILVAPPIRDRLRSWRIPVGIADLFALALAAQLVTAPLLALIGGRVSLVGVLANVLVAPVVALISIVGTIAALVGAIGPDTGGGALIGQFLLRALQPELEWMLWCARTFAGMRWAVLAIPEGAAGAALLIGVLGLAAVTGWQLGRWRV